MITVAANQEQVGQYLEVEPGVEIYYETLGKGHDLVLVPGWTFTTKVFENQFSYFSDTYRVISFDPRSQGRSTVTFAGNNYVTQGKDLTKLLKFLDVKNPVLVGWSFGCLTTWQFIKDNGINSAVAHVCIDLSPTPMTGIEGDWTEGSVVGIADFYQGIQTPEGHHDVIVGFADEVMIEKELTPEIITWVVEQSLSSPPWVASAYLAAGMFSNYLDVAKKIDEELPSLYVVAKHWEESAKRYLATHTPNSKVVAFGGHMMFWEHHEIFNRSLQDFLSEAI